MKYDPYYYIQKIGDSMNSFPYVEITIDNTKIIVINIRAGRELIYKVYFTRFDKEISGWYYNIRTNEIVKFHCCEHYVNRFNERYLKKCKRDDIGRIRVFAKRIAMTQLVEQSIALDPSKRLISIVKIKASGEYRHLHFITCYRGGGKKVGKFLSKKC